MWLTSSALLTIIICGFFFFKNKYYESKCESSHNEISSLVKIRDLFDLQKLRDIKGFHTVFCYTYIEYNIRLMDPFHKKFMYDSMNKTDMEGAFRSLKEFDSCLTIKHPINFISYREKTYHYLKNTGYKKSFSEFNSSMENDTNFSRIIFRKLASNYKAEEFLELDFYYDLDETAWKLYIKIANTLRGNHESEDYILFIMNDFQCKKGRLSKPVELDQLPLLNSILQRLEVLVEDYWEYRSRIENKNELLDLYRKILIVIGIIFYPFRFAIIIIAWAIRTLKTE